MTDNSDKVRQVFNEPEQVDPVDGAAPPPTDDHSEGDNLYRKCALFPLNDFGNGQRFSAYFGIDVMFVPRVSWFDWTGKYWRKDDDKLKVRSLAQKVAAKIKAEVKHVALDDWEIEKLAEEATLVRVFQQLPKKVADLTEEQILEKDKLNESLAFISNLKGRLRGLKKIHRTHARAAGNSGQITNMMIESTTDLSRELDDLDADPLEINTESGVLKFKVDETGQRALRNEGCSDMEGTVTFECLPHTREQMLSKIAPVEYDEGAKCPLFLKFINRILPDSDVREFLQRWYGLSMTGLIGDQKMVFQYGTGSNGKSVLVDLVARMLGGYSATAKIESLTGTHKRGGGDATPDLIPLIGARFVRASEPEEGERLKEGTIKSLTSGEPILVRPNFGEFVEVLPQFKLTISGNHKPEIRGTDDGIWRRVLLTPFEVKIPPEEVDKQMGEKLWVERAGILNWLIDGLISYLEYGLREPETVLAATKEFREESDPIQAFLTTCCEFAEDAPFVRSSEIVIAFKIWQKQSGMTPWYDTTITRRMSDRADKWRDPRTGLKFSKHKSSVSGYRGFRLTDEMTLEMDKAEAASSKSKF